MRRLVVSPNAAVTAATAAKKLSSSRAESIPAGGAPSLLGRIVTPAALAARSSVGITAMVPGHSRRRVRSWIDRQVTMADRTDEELAEAFSAVEEPLLFHTLGERGTLRSVKSRRGTITVRIGVAVDGYPLTDE